MGRTPLTVHHKSQFSANGTFSRLFGGLLMFLAGVLYLLFEKSIISQSKSGKGELAFTSVDSLSRKVLGVQVGTA